MLTENQAQGKPRIRVTTSLPSLQGKVKIDIKEGTPLDAVYWYIKFNLPLDPDTVNGKTMQVTDTDGYIMRTVINYQPQANLISVSPLDSYEEERYYLLKISNKVCSLKGTYLRSNINILFKLYEGQMNNYLTVRQDVPVPDSVPRPEDYDEWQSERTLNDLDNYADNYPKRMKMELDNVKIRLWLGILGLIAVLFGIISMNIIVIAISLLVCIIGAVHIFTQWRNPRTRSKMFYNKGVKHFNQLQYQLAKEYFEASLEINPKNDLAKYAIARVGLYKL